MVNDLKPIPLPGDHGGPCSDPCDHPKCLFALQVVGSVCTVCGSNIGYQVPWTIIENDDICHASCVTIDRKGL